MDSPFKGTFRVTQPYKGRDHQGIDLVGETSKNIYATVSGDVVAATTDTYPDGGMGRYVKLKDIETGHFYLFGHMSEWKVKTGDKVTKGTLIGVEGNTGHSFGSHCHYEVRKDQSSSSFLDVAAISGIPNKIGTYVQSDEITDYNTALLFFKEHAGIDTTYWERCGPVVVHLKELIIKMANGWYRSVAAKFQSDNYGDALKYIDGIVGIDIEYWTRCGPCVDHLKDLMIKLAKSWGN